MNLARMLRQRAEIGRPLRIGLIGAGKFGSMFLAQARTTPGFHLAMLADLDPARARAALATTGWPAEQFAAGSPEEALTSGGLHVTEDAEALFKEPRIEVVIDATGNTAAGIRHALAAAHHGKHIVMVNVEADVLAGPYLAAECAKAGVVYSMAYGDQPALICELVDWAGAVGLPVVAAGKGTKYLPEYHASTPDTVWDYYGLSPEQAQAAGMNPQMFNSFLDGTKSAIEMAAVANGTGLTPPPDGLSFPPCPARELAKRLQLRESGGWLHHKGQVEVVSCLERDGSAVPDDLRWGVYVVFEAPSDYTARCFGEYGLVTDDSGRQSALWRPYHLIGLELGVSVANAVLRGEPTGTPSGFRGDVAAVAKRALGAGEILDGEGGYRVWGKLLPAAVSLEHAALPIGLAHGVKLRRDIAEGEVVGWADVEIDETAEAVAVRRRMEREFAESVSQAAQ
jgi:predicted homoserine dehydrogenase-like protein